MSLSRKWWIWATHDYNHPDFAKAVAKEFRQAHDTLQFDIVVHCFHVAQNYRAGVESFILSRSASTGALLKA
jgi:hypothetical protein